ncbi:GntR family transcriptional regulator [Alteribacillus iranensis]|uniref:GntR family transcriptional regulator n=1 Tax=Alteribacillus iranensis TaxID=930128 RepID=A0A1I2E0K9_9BACI|nr:GntR family transcriptional regulator [Alteribacillus iranensis]SFE86452.1 GntR family transcriptional regulator [Alteribacillus iranensis]
MFELDPRNRKPIYEQLMEKIKELILAEVLTVDEKLPSVRMLSKELTINPNTIQKAYRELEREGYLYSANRKGYFVAPIELHADKKVNELKTQFQHLLREAVYLGVTKEQIAQWFDEIEKGEEKSD